jgi:hypothetical protein
MKFYPSKNNDRLNRRPFEPDVLIGRAMVNPHYRVRLAPGTKYIKDSGGFQERDMLYRLQPWDALDRQQRLEAYIEYSGHGGHGEATVTYDMLDGVDEAIVDGKRKKQRGNEQTASLAVRETVRSAHYYHSQRHRIRGAIAYACQGASPAQYLACAEQLLSLIRPGVDWFAFGGFCIIGQIPRLKPVFYETLRLVLPLLERAGVTRAHILGVTVADAILEASRIAHGSSVILSTDSSGPERNAAIYGKEFVTHGKRGPRFTRCYEKDQKFVDYHPADWAMENIRRYNNWTQTLQGGTV